MLRSALMLLCLAPPLLAADPPAPDLKKPVDYAAWLNETYGQPGEGENAAPQYNKIFKTMFAESQAGENAATQRAGFQWSDSDLLAVQEWTRQNENALAAFAETSKLKWCFFEFGANRGLRLQESVPSSKAVRTIGVCATARARLRLRDGDAAGAIDDVIAVLRAARHLQLQPTLQQYKHGRTLADKAYATLREAPRLARKPLDYEAMLQVLRKEDRAPVSIRLPLETQSAFFLEQLQHDGSDSDGDGRLEMVMMPGNTPLPISPPASLADLAAMHEQVLSLVRKMPGVKYPAARDIVREGQSLIARMQPEALQVLMPSLWEIDKERRAHDARCNAARAVVAIHAHQAASGRWPATLKEAMKNEASSLRDDPFSAGDLVYKLQNDQPLLYSVGANGSDEGGKRQGYDRYGENGDIVFWPPPE